MSLPFDPYHTWLGIPAAEQPPNYYRLLGINALEKNSQVIQAAADRITIYLRSQTSGPHGEHARRILSEVETAQQCLLNPPMKAGYDQILAVRLAPAETPGPPAPTPISRPLPIAASLPAAAAIPKARTEPSRPMPVAARPIPAPGGSPSAPQFEAPLIADAPKPASTAGSSTGSASATAKRTKPGGEQSVVATVKIVVGGIAGLALGVLIVYYLTGQDLLGWAKSGQQEVKNKKVIAKAPPRTTPRTVRPSTTPRSVTTPGETVVEPREPTETVTTVPEPTGPTIPSETSKSETKPPLVLQPAPEGTTSKSSSTPMGSSETVGPPTLEDLTKPGATKTPPAVKRGPVPSSADQQAKLAAVKEIYKAEFANASKPANLASFVEFLVNTAESVDGDPGARYVLYTEAYRRACALNDFVTAAEVIDKMEEEFEVDPFRLRYDVITKFAAGVKTPEDRFTLANSSLELVDHALARSKIDEAEKLARIAEAQTKILVDKDLRAKALAIVQATSQLNKDWAGVDAAKEKLAQSPDDPAANTTIGRYTCLVEGKWEEGLKLLAKGGDGPLKTAADMDLAGPQDDITAGKIADAWFDLATANKTQAHFFARADYWYEKAAAGATGLEAIRVKQRREQIAGMGLPPHLLGKQKEMPDLAGRSAVSLITGSSAAGSGSTDLLPLVIEQTAKPSDWEASRGRLESPRSAQNTAAFVEASLPVPRRDYYVQCRIIRSSSIDTTGKAAGGIMLGMMKGGRKFAVVIDEAAGNGQRLAYITMGSTPESKNPTVVRYTQTKVQYTEVTCSVTRDAVVVYVGGAELMRYDGDASLLALPPGSPFAASRPFFYAQDRGVNIIDNWQVGEGEWTSPSRTPAGFGPRPMP